MLKPVSIQPNSSTKAHRHSSTFSLCQRQRDLTFFFCTISFFRPCLSCTVFYMCSMYEFLYLCILVTTAFSQTPTDTLWCGVNNSHTFCVQPTKGTQTHSKTNAHTYTVSTFVCMLVCGFSKPSKHQKSKTLHCMLNVCIYTCTLHHLRIALIWIQECA